MSQNNEPQDPARLAAALLGRLGGKAGRGAAKRRSIEHYKSAGLKSAEVRRLKKLQKT